MTDFAATFAAMHEHRIISGEEFPELEDSHARTELQRLASRVGLEFSYDERTGTATLFHAADAPEGGTLHHATVLIAWMHLVWRVDQAQGAQHGDDRAFLTSEARRRNRENKDYSITAPFLSTRFHNTYPTLKAASNALERLKKKGLVEPQGKDPIRYYAAPLLRHVVDEDSALNIVWGHVQGSFEDLQPLRLEGMDPRDRVLGYIETVAEGYANAPRIADELDMNPQDVERICQNLRNENLIEHHFGTSQGGAWYRTYASEEEE